MKEVYGLPIQEFIIPILSWSLICLQYLYLLHRGAFHNAFHNFMNDAGDVSRQPLRFHYPYLFFSKVRQGWVRQNFLTGQASANTTRDFLRVILFFASNAAVLGILVVSYAVASFKGDNSPRQMLRSFQLALLACILLIIFFIFLLSTRYALHHHFLMNVKFIDDVPMHLPVIQRVFERAYAYYTAGLRMYFALIPMFAWLVSCWLLLGITIPHLYLVHSYDNMDWLDKEVSEMYSSYQPLLQDDEEKHREAIHSPPPPSLASPSSSIAAGVTSAPSGENSTHQGNNVVVQTKGGGGGGGRGTLELVPTG